MFRKFFTIIILLTALGASAQVTDSVATDSTTTQRPFYRRGFIGKVVNYFENTNKPRPDKAFDVSFVGGPHFSSETGVGIGIVGSGRYKATHRTDSLTPYSNVSLGFDITTGQMYKVMLEGFNIAGHDRSRLNYDIEFYSFKDRWWGIGYRNGDFDGNESKYNHLQLNLATDYVWRVGSRIFMGPKIDLAYMSASNMRMPGDSLLMGQPLKVFDLGGGVTFMYDSRDIITGATRGIYVRVDALAFARGFGNGDHNFLMTELTASGYKRVWRGGILAGCLHARLTQGHTPWSMLSTFGGSRSMRGYWEGRYRDKNAADLTVELRQHVWKRSGIVVWAGVGSVFPRFDAIQFNQLLPCAGVGWRWELKKGVNVRLDVGRGKNETTINFGLNEVF